MAKLWRRAWNRRGCWLKFWAVPTAAVDYGQVVMEAANSFHNGAQPTDTNNDGTVSAIDALGVINLLNDRGAMSTVEMRAAPTAASVLSV